ncbi:MAG: glycosyltransferase [Rhodospirillaceae bacterium]|nr:glycosyltransferase [Rhodospirillaceae bacterium]MBT3883464.1 glycosyltransferase [Rhodospirillaceae bacterium]MBT4114800.1 glycosyltransferase [Rhodospirillaceae bacterium]MBT4674124.1 glycosyltransferase [Rhodospirillaceae bacterium]MBT4748229.1 glycosyltransferase [Rhodospirillaceae bacterium]
MALKNHLIIFTRTPRLGAAKRRLTADIGGVAMQFARANLADLARKLGSDARWSCALAVSPDQDASDGYGWPAGLARIPQGPGNLGDRMARAMARMPPGPVVIIGADIPEITSDHIGRAFAALGRGDAVFGPARDGGYWLVGLRRRPHIPDIFGGVRWSSRHALVDTASNLGPGTRISYLDTLADIDSGDDYRAWNKRRQRK